MVHRLVEPVGHDQEGDHVAGRVHEPGHVHRHRHVERRHHEFLVDVADIEFVVPVEVAVHEHPHEAVGDHELATLVGVVGHDPDGRVTVGAGSGPFVLGLSERGRDGRERRRRAQAYQHAHMSILS